MEKNQNKDRVAVKSPSNGIKEFFQSLLLRVPIQEQVAFARYLAVMAKAGLPLIDSLKMIQKGTKSKAMLKILDQVIKDVSNGQFLSASLEKFQSVFGDFFVNIIRVGESAGILSENLNYLAEELKKKQELKKRVIGALIYPAVVMGATFGITGLLIVFIFPKILPVFSSLNVKLPASTRFLIAISNLLTNHGFLILLGVLFAFVGFWIFLKIKKIRFYFHYFLLYVPIFGKIFRDVSLANICRTLGLTLKSGVKVVEAVTITSGSIANLAYKNQLLRAVEGVKKGETLASHFVKTQHLFPIMLSQMISVGETAGNLSDTLLYLSEFYESEVNEATKNLSNVLEPVLMVLMGVVVGFVAISIITPIYEVSRSVGR